MHLSSSFDRFFVAAVLDDRKSIEDAGRSVRADVLAISAFPGRATRAEKTPPSFAYSEYSTYYNLHRTQ